MVDWNSSIRYSEVLDKRIETLRKDIEARTTTIGLACHTLWVETSHVCGLSPDDFGPDDYAFFVDMYNRLNRPIKE